MADWLDPQEIIKRADRLRADRATTETHWQDVADYILPSREFTRSSTAGAKRSSLIYHTGPVMAAEQLAGALHGMLISPSLRWFALRSDSGLDEDAEAKRWFEDATDRMFQMFTSPSRRFDLNAHESLLDISGFGNGVLFISDKGRVGPQFKSLPLSECFLSENDDGNLDTLYRCFKMRAIDIANTPGWDVPRELSADAADRPDTMWECIHAIFPDPKKRVPYVGRYVLKRTKTALGREERYEEQPFIASRWSKRSGESLGFGPGMNALPDVKGLNKLEEEHLRGVMLANSPSIAVPDDGFLSTINRAPRAINYYRAELQGYEDRVFTIPTGERPEVAADKILNLENRVREAFYIQWMNLPQRPNMTATEVIQRRDEMLRLMGPMVSRLQTEMLGPVITRCFNVMWRNGMLLPPPTSMRGSGWHIEYSSPLAAAQKSSDAGQALQFLQAISAVAAGDPTVLDKVDGDEMVDFLADRMGAPAKAMRDDEAIARLRHDRSQREMAMQNAMAADAASKMLAQGGQGINALAQAATAGQGMAA